MRRFTFTIELGNDAMLTRDDIAECLCKVAMNLVDGSRDTGCIRDRNGNAVGTWKIDVGDAP